MKYAIAGSNIEYAKEICKRENIDATFAKAPYGNGYTMIAEHMTRGEFKDFKEDMLCLRMTKKTRSLVPFVGRRTLQNPKKLSRISKTVNGRKCFRATEEELDAVFG